jgi:hypothetical protein
MNWKSILSLSAMLSVAGQSFCADVPKAPVPVSPFIRVVYGYADAMLKHGRNQDGIFWSALDRATLAPLTNRPPAPEGVRLSDRVGTNDAPLVGSNPYHDENLLRLLSMLTDLSAKPHYRAAADVELKWFLESARPESPEQFRPWMLWDRCFELEPEASKRILLRLSQKESAVTPSNFQRAAGFNVRALAIAYARTKDEQFTSALANVVSRYDTSTWLDFTPSLAIDCEGAAHRVPEPLAAHLRMAAGQQDLEFCSLPHDVKKNGGFVSARPRIRGDSNPRHTSLWKASHDTRTTAQVGMMCVSRYDNTGDVGYRDLILGAADAYLNSLPADTEDAWPATFGHAISLQLAAWRHSADWKYMERARQFGDIAVEKFWGTNALPKASFKIDHYESITGADTLALALTELHLHILHITAVRCPPNTIDR